MSSLRLSALEVPGLQSLETFSLPDFVNINYLNFQVYTVVLFVCCMSLGQFHQWLDFKRITLVQA